MRLISKLIFVPVAAVFVIFAVANRKSVTLEMWPLPFAVDLPLYLAVLGALLALCVPTSTRTAQREGAANADAREASWSARPSDPLIAPGGPDSPVPPGDCQAAPVAGGRDAARSAIS